jgi:hypothetical protein
MRAYFVEPGLAVLFRCLTKLVAVLIRMLLELFALVLMVLCLHLLVMTSLPRFGRLIRGIASGLCKCHPLLFDS